MTPANHLRAMNALGLRRAAQRSLAPRMGRRLKKPPRMIYPGAAERGYAALLRRLVADFHGLVVTHLIPALPAILAHGEARRPTADADDADQIKKLMDLLRSQFFALYDDATLAAMVERVAEAVETANFAQMGKVFRAVVGVDLFKSEPWLGPEMKLFTTSNVALIKSIATRYHDDISTIVYAGAAAGQRADDLADAIAERFGVTQSRATFIARDQIGKFNGNLAELRQTQAGVEKYIWRTSKDERVRKSHQEMEGKVCEWSNPPDVGGRALHPGADFRCRCFGEPVLEDLAP